MSYVMFIAPKKPIHFLVQLFMKVLTGIFYIVVLMFFDINNTDKLFFYGLLLLNLIIFIINFPTVAFKVQINKKSYGFALANYLETASTEHVRRYLMAISPLINILIIYLLNVFTLDFLVIYKYIMGLSILEIVVMVTIYRRIYPYDLDTTLGDYGDSGFSDNDF